MLSSFPCVGSYHMRGLQSEISSFLHMAVFLSCRFLLNLTSSGNPLLANHAVQSRSSPAPRSFIFYHSFLFIYSIIYVITCNVFLMFSVYCLFFCVSVYSNGTCGCEVRSFLSQGSVCPTDVYIRRQEKMN